MAEEFETGICGGSWWNNLMMISNNPSRSGGGFIGGGGGGGSSFCSLGNTPTADFGSWVAPDLMMPSSCKDVDVAVSNNSSISDGSVVFQNDADSGGSTGGGGSVMMDSSALQLMGFGLSSSSPSSSDWNQQHRAAFMNGGGSERIDDGGNFDWCNRTAEDPLNNLSAFCNIDQQQSSLNDNLAVVNSGLATTITTTSYGGYPSTLIQSLFEPDVPQPPPPLFSDSLLLNEFASSSPSWPKFQRPNHNNYNHDHHHPDLGISNDTPFWDSTSSTTSVSRSVEGINRGGFTKPLQGHAQARFGQANFEQKPTSCPNISTTKQPKKEEGSNSNESKSGTKKGTSSSNGSEPAFKRPRIETPSPLPTFKVRKEKLGDRITALQQLVSPFGKTDTASVLHEAIEYIKFLHDQVSVLSTPYMKNGNPSQQHQQGNGDCELDQTAQNQPDLRTRGLCLVPISSTFPVASETTADFWTPTFGGSFR